MLKRIVFAILGHTYATSVQIITPDALKSAFMDNGEI